MDLGKVECKKAHEKYKKLVRDGFKVGDIPIALPEPPTHFSIEGYGNKKENRKFKKIVLPDIIVEDDGTTRFDLPSDKEEKLIYSIVDKRINGHFFYNGDKLEYITGDHWYYLNFMKIPIIRKDKKGVPRKEVDTPFFVDGDRNWFYFIREAELDPYCFGTLFVTKRRDGKSYKALSKILNNATLHPNTKYGMMAQTGTIARSLFARMIKMWKELPEHRILSPMHTGDDSPQQKLVFEKPKGKTKGVIRKHEDVLGNTIDWRNTAVHSYDSEGMDYLFIDEASKMDSINVKELFNVQRETLSNGSIASGKMIVTSTAENIGGRTLKQFEALYSQSDYRYRDPITNQTESGMWKYFQTAAIGYRHDPSEGHLSEDMRLETIDEWGYSNIENAERIIKALRKNKKGNDLIQFKRKYPLSEEEAFSYDSQVSPFDLVKIGEQIEINKNIEDVQPLCTRGNFEWRNGVKDSEVVWIPKEEGRWLRAWMPDEIDRNKVRYQGNVKFPRRNDCVSGVDPYDHKEVIDESRMSDCASHIYHKNKKAFVCQYLTRYDISDTNQIRISPNEMYEDILKQCVFYSCYLLPENQKYGIINYFEERGYIGYIMRNPLEKEAKLQKLGISTRGNDTRQRMIRTQEDYIYNNVGINDRKNTHGYMPFTQTLKDWQRFEEANWTPYDLTVSSMITLIAATEKPKSPFKYDKGSDWGF